LNNKQNLLLCFDFLYDNKRRPANSSLQLEVRARFRRASQNFCADFQNSPSPNHHLTTHQQPSSKPQPNNPNSTKLFSTFLRAKMASPYSAQDQAADLGIHRVHNLVLGDARKEARLARFSPPQLKRPVMGRGDVRMAEHQYEWETRRELERIARRHNLKAYVPPSPKILSDDNLFLSFLCI
jgi:hypothetical protein